MRRSINPRTRSVVIKLLFLNDATKNSVARPTLSQILSLKIRRSTLLNIIKFVNRRIVRLLNCERAGRMLCVCCISKDLFICLLLQNRLIHWIVLWFFARCQQIFLCTCIVNAEDEFRQTLIPFIDSKRLPLTGELGEPQENKESQP